MKFMLSVSRVWLQNQMALSLCVLFRAFSPKTSLTPQSPPPCSLDPFVRFWAGMMRTGSSVPCELCERTGSVRHTYAALANGAFSFPIRKACRPILAKRHFPAG